MVVTNFILLGVFFLDVLVPTYLFGKRFKNQLFVGGLPQDTTAQELAEYFSHFSPVIKVKAISDEYQLPKGYGFVTFQSQNKHWASHM